MISKLKKILWKQLQEYNKKKILNRKDSFGEFYRAGGNKLLHQIKVNSAGVILDCGGYEGDWTAEIIARTGCRAEIYEPIPEYYLDCKNRFALNPRVNVHQSGVGSENKRVLFTLSDNGTSEHINKHGEGVEVNIVDIKEIIEKIVNVDCLKLNIEGGEYDVLERLLGLNLVDRCNLILVQFHRQPDGYEKRYEKIVANLKSTHEMLWGFNMVWELWSRKKSA